MNFFIDSDIPRPEEPAQRRAQVREDFQHHQAVQTQLQQTGG